MIVGWLTLLQSRFARYAALALAALGVILAIRRDATKDALRDAEDKDHENADSIRRNVERDLDQRVRDYEGRGFRDE